jgi:hypothetical protein
MKNLIIKLTVLLAIAFPVTGGCGLVSIFTSDHVSWSFMQSVGGISVGTPNYLESGKWHIPVDCDVSGFKTITVKPTMINSALVVRKIKTKVKADSIQVWVITSVVDKHNKSPSSSGATLKNITEGSYKIEYLNPDSLYRWLRPLRVTRGSTENDDKNNMGNYQTAGCGTYISQEKCFPPANHR